VCLSFNVQGAPVQMVRLLVLITKCFEGYKKRMRKM